MATMTREFRNRYAVPGIHPEFIPYSALKREIEAVGARIEYMKAEFIESIAVSCEPDEA